MMAWKQALAEMGTQAFGYDGLERNAWRWASERPSRVGAYPFHTLAEFEQWLARLSRRQRRPDVKK